MSKNRKQKRSRKHRNHRGGNAVRGAPITQSLAGSWPSRMSLGQGGDYFKYHQGQHGGVVFQGAPMSSITGSGLPDALRGPAHIAGLDKAYADIRGLKDQAGGRRTRRRKMHCKNKSHRHKNHRNKSHKNKSRRNKSRRSRGGALGYAPFPSGGMLLDKVGYQQAGLNPEWKSDISYSMAKIRDSQ